MLSVLGVNGCLRFFRLSSNFEILKVRQDSKSSRNRHEIRRNRRNRHVYFCTAVILDIISEIVIKIDKNLIKYLRLQ